MQNSHYKKEEITMKQSVVYVLVVTLIVAGFLAGCGLVDKDDDSGGKAYKCSYQKRSSQTCNHYDWGAWQSACTSFNSDDLTVSPEQYCNNLTKGGLYCASSCCIDSQYQNVNLAEGTCP
jgi:uncharacterized protein YceK